jgi:hypothetical protein
MRIPLCRGLSIPFVIVVIGMARNAVSQTEPVYDGKALSAWMGDFDPKKPYEVRDTATNALKQRGTNALPFLVAEVRKVEELYHKNPTNFYKTPASLNRFYGIRSAFTALGSVAKPAIPDLENELNNGKYHALAAELLEKIDPDAAAVAFAKALKSENLDVRIAAIS